jgi:ornithine cyclodeaminase
VKRARLFTDRRESCLAEAGDFLLARAEGAVTDDHLLGEVGDVFLGRLQGRTGRKDITLFESLGVAVEDLAAAHALLRRARETGAGTWLEWGGPAGG